MSSSVMQRICKIFTKTYLNIDQTYFSFQLLYRSYGGFYTVSNFHYLN